MEQIKMQVKNAEILEFVFQDYAMTQLKLVMAKK